MTTPTTELDSARSLAKSLQSQLRSANDLVEETSVENQKLSAELETERNNHSACHAVKTELAGKLSMLNAELERVNRANAEMREVLEASSKFLYAQGYRSGWEILRRIEKALSSDAGTDYVSREQVEPLVEALQVCQADSEILNQGSGCKTLIDRISDASFNALKHARSIGVLKENAK